MGSPSISQKCCTKCGKKYPPTPEYFSRHASHKDGLNSQCKQCVNDSKRVWRETHQDLDRERKHRYTEKHREEEASRARRWHSDHREYANAKSRFYHEQHREEANKKARLYRKEHPEVAREAARRRKMRKRALPATLTQTEWEQILADYRYSCAYCGKAWFEIEGKLHKEHVIPVDQGGGYTADNIVPSCAKCNFKKRNKTPEQAGMKLLPKTSRVL